MSSSVKWDSISSHLKSLLGGVSELMYTKHFAQGRARGEGCIGFSYQAQGYSYPVPRWLMSGCA